MRQRIFSEPYRIYSYDELTEEDRQLIDEARRATFNSYSPYSRFSVGAALRLHDGNIVCGSNQENAAYPSGLCAERTALFYANSQYPGQAVEALAIAARNERGEFVRRPVSPCGACRQAMLETERRFRRPLRVLLAGTENILELPGISLLLPFSFDASSMEQDGQMP